MEQVPRTKMIQCREDLVRQQDAKLDRLHGSLNRRSLLGSGKDLVGSDDVNSPIAPNNVAGHHWVQSA